MLERGKITTYGDLLEAKSNNIKSSNIYIYNTHQKEGYKDGKNVLDDYKRLQAIKELKQTKKQKQR